MNTTTNNGVAGADRVMFTFTALAGCPANVRIGVATDGLDGAQFSPASIGLGKVGGSSAEQPLTAVNNTLDMVFFDVKGVVQGEQFQVFGDTGTGGFVTIQFVTWDVIPIVVTNANDLGPGSLRAALAQAAAQPGADTIVFDPGMNGKTIALSTFTGSGFGDTAFTIPNGEVVTVDATALSAGVKLDGGSRDFRFFLVNAGASLTLHGLTLANGGGASFDGSGGAIYNSGTAMLTHCTLSGNTTTNSLGGGICNARGLTTLTHCTLSGNTAPAGKGSGVASFGNSDVETRVQNCIISGNTNSSVDFIDGTTNTFRSLGGNLIGSGNAIGDFNVASDILSNAPQLAALADNGGPTQTRALLANSPARNAAAVLEPAITTDQRGFPLVGLPDIGAYEAGTFTNYNAWIYETLPTATSYAWDAAVPDAQHASTFDFDGDGVTNGNEWQRMDRPHRPRQCHGLSAHHQHRAQRSQCHSDLPVRHGPDLHPLAERYAQWRMDGYRANRRFRQRHPRAFTIPAPVNGVPKRFYRVQVSS